MQKVWSRTPTILKAVFLGFVMLFPIVLLNQRLIQNNVENLADIPWAFVMVVLLLWLFWQLATGKEHPFGKSNYRRVLSMTKIPVSSKGLGGILGLSSALLLFVYAANAIGFAIYGFDDTVQLVFIQYVSTAPKVTAILLLLATALTAGVVEEIVFRGYIQKLIDDKYGPIMSFLFVGIIFTMIHFLPIQLLLPYFLVSIAFSWVVFQTGSVIPGIIVHILFDFMAFMAVYFDLPVASQRYLMDTLLLNVVLVITAIGGLWFASKRRC